jgi:hypothetical protein
VEAATLPRRDRATLRGLPVTSLRRTVAECLRHCPPPDGLAIVDAALAGQPSCRDDIAAVLEECAEWPFARKASAVLALADGRRQSPLESWSVWKMHRFGMPLPQPQCLVYDRNGVFLGRVDF